MIDAPKLYTNKPKKSQLKPQGSSSMGTTAAPPPPPPAQPPRESFARRYKFVWPVLLAVNLSIGAYLFMRTKKKNTSTENEVAETLPSSSSITVTTPTVVDKTLSTPKILEPVKLPEPIPEDQQRELFKWILEEKRKTKPKNSEEKKRIDEDKAILKQFIRAKSIPRL